MPDLAAIGRTMMNRMVSIASVNGGGAKPVSFALISATTYDPTADTDTSVTTTVQTFAFLDKASDKETKTGGENREAMRLVLSADALPRLPTVEDEVTVEGRLWKVEGAERDAMGVQLYVDLVIA